MVGYLADSFFVPTCDSSYALSLEATRDPVLKHSMLVEALTTKLTFRRRFADVTHEVKPVLSGRRLVLTYNLMHTSLQASELTADANKGALKLRNVLRSWMHNIQKDVKVSHVLGYLLEHQYTAASLRVDGLKGHDRQVIANIRDVCDQEGMCLYLANLDIKIEGGCDEDDDEEVDGYHEIIEEIDKTVTLKRVVQLDGIEVAQDLDFDESLFVQNSPLTDQPPDREEDYSGYTGNEGVSATHFYHRTVRKFCIASCTQLTAEPRFYL